MLTEVRVDDRATRDVACSKINITIAELGRLSYASMEGNGSDSPHFHLISRATGRLEGC